MKTKFLNLFAIVTIIAGAISCKGEKKNETEATTAEEVKEAPVTAVTYNVDTSASTIEWTGKKLTGQHTGTIKIGNGTINTTEGNIESGTFVIDMASITVTDLEGESKDSLEAHLKGEGEEKGKDHFFNVSKFPVASFEVTGISEKEGKTFVEGNLTMKEIKKNISFPVTTTSEGNSMNLTSEVFTINRTDWGVNYGSKSIFDNLGDKYINDDIELKISVKANKA